MTANPEPSPLRRRGSLVRKNFAVLYRVDQAEPEHRQGNAERDIVLLHLLFEIGLSERATPESRVVADARHDPQLMHATVGDRSRKNIARAVDLVFEADLADRPKPLLEARHNIVFAEAVWNQIELRIFRGVRRHPSRNLLGIGDEKASGAAKSRLEVAAEALVGVVARAQPVRVGSELREDRVEFFEPVDRIHRRRRPICDHGALVAGGFQLAGPIDAFQE